MKTFQKTSLLFVAASSLLLLPAMVNAQYTWGGENGTWGALADWSGSPPTGGPNGVDVTIYSVNTSGTRTVTLGGNQLIGNIDWTVNNNRTYIFAPGTPSTSTLTLETSTTPTPSVTVGAGATGGSLDMNVPLAGSQGFTMSSMTTGPTSKGTGLLQLAAANTIQGTVTVNNGWLMVNGSGSLPLGAPVTIGSGNNGLVWAANASSGGNGGVLGGNGTVNDAVTLTSGGFIIPGTAVNSASGITLTPGTLTVGSLSWTGGGNGAINEVLGTSSSLLALSSAGSPTAALTLTGSTFNFNITQGAGFSTANTYELMSFVNDPDPSLPVSDFTGAPAGMQFALDPTDEYLELEPTVVVPEPSTIALLIGGAAGVWQLRRRKA
jgi:autotransporter-associated beta strand protein